MTAAATLARPAPAGFVGRLSAPAALSAPAWLAALRQAAWTRLLAAGLPTRRVEAWRYTSLGILDTLDMAAAPDHAALDQGLPAPLPAGHHVTVVDGRLRADLSSLDDLPAGIVVLALDQALASRADLLSRHFGRQADGALADLNTAQFRDLVLIHIAAGTVLDRPLALRFVASAGPAPTAVYPRLLVVAEAGSSATLIEDHVGTGTTLSVPVTEIILADTARLHHVKLQREAPTAFHLSDTTARLGRDALYDNFVLILGAQLSRNGIRPLLDGTGVTCRLSGAYRLSGRQHADTATVIDHAHPHGTSRQVYKGVIDGSARAVFQGRILVRPQAQKTDGYQVNRALLLSDQAEIDSKPELEIHADDVKCSHGATIGELDEDQLFYLRARGIDRDTARHMLVGAFLTDALAEIGDASLRDAFERLAGEKQ